MINPWLVIIPLLIAAPAVLRAEPAAAPLHLTISDEVAATSIHRFGINVDDTWWDAGAVANIRAAYTFEGTLYRSIFTGPRQDETGLFTWQPLTTLDPTYGVERRLDDASFTVLNGPAKGHTGRIARVERRVFEYRELDYLVFDREVPANPGSAPGVMIERDGLAEGHLPVIGGGKKDGFWSAGDLALVSGDVAPESTGTTALRMDASDRPARLRLPGRYRDLAEVGGTWTLDFRVKALTGQPQISLLEPATARYEPATNWASAQWTFTVNATQAPANLTALLEVTGGTVLLDDLVFQHTTATNPTAFSDAFVAALRDLQPGWIRHLQMGGSTVLNTIRPATERVRFSSSPWMRTGPHGGPFAHRFSLHDLYTLCAEVGANPWFCLPGVLHPDEVRDFMEYLGAPPDVGYGRLRASLGQTQPWTDVFDEIIVEFGNEAWNTWGPFACGGFNGPEYWEDLITAGRNSPWHRPPVRFVSAGQNVNDWLNQRIIADTPGADQFALATYVLHRLEPAVEEKLGDDRDALYRWLFSLPGLRYGPGSGMAENARHVRAAGQEIAVYETNHHTSDGDASSAFRNRFLTGLGGGLNALQTMLLMLEDYGVRNQCFFTAFGEANNAYTVKDVRLFGAYLSLTDREIRKRPHALALEVANRAILPERVTVQLDRPAPVFTAPVFDEKERTWTGHTTETPALRVLSFRDGTARSLLLLNLHVNEPLNLLLDLPGPAEDTRAEWWQLATPGIEDHNEREHPAPTVNVTSGQWTDFTAGYPLVLPPHSLTTVRWKQTATP
jgi:hypothetical protein